MTLKQAKFHVTRGQTKGFRFTVTDAAGAPFDLTGWNIRFTVAKTPEAQATIAEDKTVFSKVSLSADRAGTADAISVESPETLGVFTVHLKEADTTGLADHPYVADCWLYKGSTNADIENQPVILPSAFEVRHAVWVRQGA